MTEEQIREIERNRDKLKLLVDPNSESEDNVKTNGATDSRFSSLIQQNKEFARDPTHKDYNKIDQKKTFKSKSWGKKK